MTEIEKTAIKNPEIDRDALVAKFKDIIEPFFKNKKFLQLVIDAYRYKLDLMSGFEPKIFEDLVFHMSIKSFDTPFADHSVIAMEVALNLTSNLVEDKISVMTADGHSEMVEKEEFMMLVAVAKLLHDTGFLKRYKENESIGAKFAEKWMEKIDGSIFDKYRINVVIETILATDVHGLVLPKVYDVSVRDRILEINPIAAIVSAADLLAIVDPLRGKMSVNNYLFRLECLNVKDSPLHKSADKWDLKVWVEDARDFYSKFFKKYKDLMVGLFPDKNQYLENKFKMIFEKLNSGSWLRSFAFLEYVRGIYPELLIEYSAAIQEGDLEAVRLIRATFNADFTHLELL